MLFLACFVALFALRISGAPEARLVSGALVMALGIWLLLGVTGVSFVHGIYFAPRFLGLIVGVWFVVKGALRLAYD
jgi:hypothetical protein